MEYAIRHGFDDLGAHRIFLEVVESNYAARRLYESVGFRDEGLYRDGFLNEAGIFQNLVPYGMLVSDLRSRAPFNIRRFTSMADLPTHRRE
jgi:RimJ/RimL family protein N-acetyltransferase